MENSLGKYIVRKAFDEMLLRGVVTWNITQVERESVVVGFVFWSWDC